MGKKHWQSCDNSAGRLRCLCDEVQFVPGQFADVLLLLPFGVMCACGILCHVGREVLMIRRCMRHPGDTKLSLSSFKISIHPT